MAGERLPGLVRGPRARYALGVTPRATLALCALLIVGCDGDEPTDAGAPELDAGRSDGGAPDAGFDAGGRPDAGPDVDAGSEPPTYTGFVEVVVSDRGTQVNGTLVERGAHELTSHLPDCTAERAVGSCTFLRCMTPYPPSSAGLIEVDGRSGTIASVLPGSPQHYAFETMSRDASAGETLTITAAGDVVSAFTGQVDMPARITPTIPASTDRTAPMTIDWTLGAEPTERVIVMMVLPSTGFVLCRTAAANGSVAIDASLLADAPTTDSAVALVRAENETAVRVGNVDARLVAADAVTATFEIR